MTPWAPTRLLVVALLAMTPVVASSCGGADEQSTPERSRPGLRVVRPDDSTHFDYDYVIPAGTKARLDIGQRFEIMPAVLEVEVGDTIRIVNEDVTGANVGIFWVPAGKTVTMEFTTPGALSGSCDVPPNGVITIIVRDKDDDAGHRDDDVRHKDDDLRNKDKDE